MSQSYRDLEIYQLSFELAIQVHELSLALPRFEMYEEGSQIRRSSKSIVSNIVEGFGRRRYKAEFVQFLTYSLSSCDETVQHLEMLYRTKSLKDEKVYEKLMKGYNELGKKLTRFIQSVDSAHQVPNPTSRKHPVSSVVVFFFLMLSSIQYPVSSIQHCRSRHKYRGLPANRCGGKKRSHGRKPVRVGRHFVRAVL